MFFEPHTLRQLYIELYLALGASILLLGLSVAFLASTFASKPNLDTPREAMK